MIDERLNEWATERQREYIEKINELGSARKAAVHFGVAHQVVDRAVKSVKKRAALAGYAPEADMTRPAPSPFVVKGTSTLYKSDGTQALQWVKTSLDRERFESVIREFTENLAEDVRGLAELTPPPAHSDSDILTMYGIGDPHLGLHSWGKETGSDFDLKEAERINCAAFDRLVSSSPDSETALINIIGDLTHADNNSAMTPSSGNILDVDTRHQKVMQVAVSMTRYTVARALTKHRHVILWVIGGNHDPHSSFAVAMCLAAFYENEPRVTVELSPSPYFYFRFGKVMIASHHGHGAKFDQLPLVMATDRPVDWGETLYRYCYIGHIHHLQRKEFPGAVVESLRTLAAGDAWHHLKGYRAGRDMVSIVHHKEFGEIERHRADVAMVREAA